MRYKLDGGWVERVFNMIGESVVKGEEVSGKGEVRLEGRLKGDYGKEEMGEGRVEMRIKEGWGKYGELG